MKHNKLKLPSCTYMYFQGDDIFKQKEKPTKTSVEKEVYETVLKNNCDLIKENDSLKKKLEIATNALEEIRDAMTSNDVYNDVPCDISEEALKQIQEVK